MLKKKSIDYILGMITGASLMIAVWACAANELYARDSGTIQKVEVVNNVWDPVNVKVIK